MFSIFTLFIYVCLHCHTTAVAEVENKGQITTKPCNIQSVYVKTERIEKTRKLLFWRINNNKFITIDRLFDDSGNQLMEKRTVSICSFDACDSRIFRRIKVVGNEIWVFAYGRNPDKGIVKRYNYCGDYLGKKPWENGDFWGRNGQKKELIED